MTNPKIILMRGIQGSGKTHESYMIQERNPEYIRVSRDELRMQTYGYYPGGHIDENLITEVETAMVRAALRVGKTVIVDAMHLKQSYINRWQKLGYPVEIVECHEQLEVLLKRNEGRTKMVPEEVIRKNFQKYTNKNGTLKKVSLKPEEFVTSAFPKYETFRGDYGMKPEVYIFDIDGTLAHNNGHRSFYDYTKVLDDDVHQHVGWVAEDLTTSHHVIVVTGRPESSRLDTEEWLRIYNIPFTALHMRADGDNRSDALVKYEILRDKIAPEYDVMGVFDDRPSVIRMWQAVGIPTFALGDQSVEF